MSTLRRLVSVAIEVLATGAAFLLVLLVIDRLN